MHTLNIVNETLAEDFKMRKLFVSVFALTSIGLNCIASQAEKSEASLSAEHHQDVAKAEMAKTGKASTDEKKINTSIGSENLALLANSSEDSASAGKSGQAKISENAGQNALEEGSVAQGKTLKLNEVNAKDFFKNPNAFVSCLEPGYWLEVPKASGDGWVGSIWVTKDVVTQLLEGKVAALSNKLINNVLLESRAAEDKAFKDTVLEALRGLGQIDAETKKDLERIKLCELTTFSEFLKEHGIERFDKGDEEFERPRVGIPVKYSDGKVVIDKQELKKVFAKRFEVADRINEIATKEIDTITSDRNKMITAKSRKKLAEIRKIAEENEQLQKKIDAEKSKNIDEITKLEHDLKTTLSEAIKKAEAMPNNTNTTRVNGRSVKNNVLRQEALEAAQKAYAEAENKLKGLSTGYAEFEAKRKENENKINELSEDSSIQSARVMEEVFDERYEDPINKARENFDRLSAPDPSKISSNELKVKKLSKEVKDQVAELNKLKKENKRLNKKITAAKKKNKDAIATAETNVKSAQEKVAEVEKMPNKTTRRNGKDTPTDAYKKAKEEADKNLESATKKLEELSAEYAAFEKQEKENAERIKQLESDEDVVKAQMVLQAVAMEKQARQQTN